MFGWCGGTLVKKQMKKDAKLAAVLNTGKCNVEITLGSEGGMEFTRPCVVAGRVRWVLSGYVLSDLTIDVQFPKGMDLGDDAVHVSFEENGCTALQRTGKQAPQAPDCCGQKEGGS